MQRSGWQVSLGAWFIVASLVACGGGGSSPAPAPAPPVATQPPVITAQPAPAAAGLGASASFSVQATGPELKYQWQKNGVAINGATAASYSTGPLTSGDHGATYSVVVSNADGSVNSNSAVLSLTLSQDQRLFEDWLLAPGKGAYALRWNLNLSGSQTSGTQHLYSESATMPASPLALGGQRITLAAPHNLAATLALPDPEPSRVLKDGVILVVPGQRAASIARYVGSEVQVDTLAQDASTVAYTQRRGGYALVQLAGSLAGTPTEMAHWYNSLFANPALLKPNASYTAGAAYLRFTAHNVGDRYNVFDCGAATTGAAISPCLSNTSLADALAAGITSASDGITYRLADGTMRTVGGVSIWVAHITRPLSSTLTLTLQYRFYFALNGHVYTGVLITDGTLIGGSYHVSNPAGATVLDRLSFLPYHLRLNQAAHDSLAAALTF
jgi:hypothetical protein